MNLLAIAIFCFLGAAWLFVKAFESDVYDVEADEHAPTIYTIDDFAGVKKGPQNDA